MDVAKPIFVQITIWSVKVSEDKLISLLDQLNEQTSKSNRVIIQRRRRAYDSDYDDD